MCALQMVLPINHLNALQAEINNLEILKEIILQTHPEKDVCEIQREVRSRVAQIMQLCGRLHQLKALITSLLAVKGLSRLRAGLRAQIKGLTSIINLICNLLRLPRSHLLATSLDVLVSEGISLPCLQDICPNLSLPVPTSIPIQH